MLAAGVVLQTQFPSQHILVACMLEGFTPSRLALFVRLSLAGFRIPEPTHLQGRLLAAGQAVVLGPSSSRWASHGCRASPSSWPRRV